MSWASRYLGDAFPFLRLQLPKSVVHKATARTLTRLAEGDRVLVDGSKLTVPLQRNAKCNFSKGDIRHNDLIGRPLSPTYLRTSKGILHRVEAPSLEHYVSLAPRLVTPVYASYASSIVSILDIHAEPFEENDSSDNDQSSRIEILEAGTGNGSLTLHLARAIAAANPPPPSAEISRVKKDPEVNNPRDAVERVWKEWKQKRRAVLHTVENVVANRFHAEKLVRGFRQGLYWPHIDFYASDVKNWIRDQSSQRPLEAGTGLLDYVILDMPDIASQLEHVHPAMRDGGKLLAFVPSITQIGECVRLIQDNSLPFALERVVELGEGISTGRVWDVRMVKPRKSIANWEFTATTPISAAVDSVTASTADSTQDEDVEGSLEEMASDEDSEMDNDAEDSPASQDQPQADRSVMICRPLVGQRTVGGGFIALFRKTPREFLNLTPEWKRSQTGKAKKRHRS